MLVYSLSAIKKDTWQPVITEQQLKIEPKTGETAYQYAHRKVHEMKKKYPKQRIDGTFWLSEYWKHHYYGALQWRNYYWIYN
jgi:hypothetical protein